MESLQLSELETILNNAANKGEPNSSHKFCVDTLDVGVLDVVLDPVLDRIFDFTGLLQSQDNNISLPTLSSDYPAHHPSLPQVVLDATAVVHEERYPGEGYVLPPPVVNFVDPNQNADESDLTSYYSDDSSCAASLPPSSSMPEFNQLTSPKTDAAATTSSSLSLSSSNVNNNNNAFQWPPSFPQVNIKSEDFETMSPCQHTPRYGGHSHSHSQHHNQSSESTSFPFVTSPSTSIPSPASTIYSASSPGTPGTSSGPPRGRRPHGSTAPYSTKSSRRRQAEKGTVEYVEKRARNNVAVRKSRAKAKEKQKETETRVQSLLDHNDQLQKKVNMLTKELTVLKGLFMNVGASIPDDFLSMIEDS